MTAERRSLRSRPRQAVAKLVLVGGLWWVVGIGSAGAVATGLVLATAGPAVAQEADRPPGEPCLPGVTTLPPGQAPNGPSPVGRCEPTGARRALDTAVWVFTLACLVGVAVLGVVLVRRDRRDGAVPDGAVAGGPSGGGPSGGGSPDGGPSGGGPA